MSSFDVLDFLFDSGSRCVNQVVELLNKPLSANLTKLRPKRSNDNALF